MPVVQPDSQALAEAKALLTCIQVTQDPTEQNRLWNRYYRLSDRVFPEVAALHARYKSLKGAERQRFKIEYMELVRRLWAATDSEAAHGDSFTTPESNPPNAPIPAQPHHKSGGRGGYGWPIALTAVTLSLIVGALWWQNARGEKDVVVTPADTEAHEDIANAPAAPPRAAPLVDEHFPALEEAPVEEIEAELARTILPEFQAVPTQLEGKGDRVEAGGLVYKDVYVIESDSQYFLRVPGEGAVVTVVKSGATVTLGEQSPDRKALLELWKVNRAEIDKATARREEKKQLRLAAHHANQKKALEARAAAQEAERWSVKGAEWVALTSEQRETERSRAYGNWRAVHADLGTLQHLYQKILRGYDAIGVSDTRAKRVQSTYHEWERVLGPHFGIEDALIVYDSDRKSVLKELAGLEEEYYMLMERIGDVYTKYEARGEEIRRMDEYLPPELHSIEAILDWDSAPKEGRVVAGRRSQSVGTGFIVADSFVMTCAHVVQGGGEIKVTSTQGTTHAAKIVISDRRNDWALLKVVGLSGQPIPVAKRKPNVGATVYCLGYPLGLMSDDADPVVGSGNIAALQRIDGDERFLQVTAPLNPGNSGGPVLDQQGRWVGIVSQKLNDLETLAAFQNVPQGLNFAVKATFVQGLITPGSGVELVTYEGDSSEELSLETVAKNVTPSIVKIEMF